MISRKMPVRLLSENIHNSKVLARLKGCVCYGHTQGEAIYINTVLPETHLCENKVNSTRGFRTMSDSSVNTYYGIISRALLEERPVSWVRKTVKSFALSKESVRMITTELGLRLMFTRAMFEYRRRAGEMIDYDLGKVRRCTCRFRWGQAVDLRQHLSLGGVNNEGNDERHQPAAACRNDERAKGNRRRGVCGL